MRMLMRKRRYARYVGSSGDWVFAVKHVKNQKKKMSNHQGLISLLFDIFKVKYITNPIFYLDFGASGVEIFGFYCKTHLII